MKQMVTPAMHAAALSYLGYKVSESGAEFYSKPGLTCDLGRAHWGVYNSNLQICKPDNHLKGSLLA